MEDPVDTGLVQRLMAALDANRPRHPLEDEGWVYYDPPSKFKPEIWDEFLAVFGEGNYQILCLSRGTNAKGEPWVRGQLMISPQGKQNAFEEWQRGQTAH